MKLLYLLFITTLFFSCSTKVFSCSTKKKSVKIYLIEAYKYQARFIGISTKDFTPDDFYREIIKGNYKDSIDIDFLSIEDYNSAYLWHCEIHNLGLLLDKRNYLDSFSVDIRRHDLEIKIPTIDNPKKIPLKSFGFWGDFFSAKTIQIDSCRLTGVFSSIADD